MRSRRYGWYAIGLLACANFLHYGNRNILFPMYADLRTAFGFTNDELGLLGTALMLPHALVTLPFGWAGDRFDRRRVIAAGLVVWSLASIASAVAMGLKSMLLCRALVGVGTAACVPVANSLLCDIFPPKDKARTVAIFNLGLFLGGAAGFGVGAILGFPYGIVALALPGLFLAILVATVDVPSAQGMAVADSWRSFARRSAELLRVRTLAWILLGSTLMAFAAGGYLAWIFEFLSKTKGLGTEKAGVLFALCLFAGLAGVLTGGRVADKLARRVAYGRLAAITIGMASTVPFALITLYADIGPAFYVASWLTMFFISWYHGPLAASIDDLAAGDRAATAQGLVFFTMHAFGTAPASYVVGALADRYGLRDAMLLPTLVVLLAAIVIMGAWRTAGADQAAARAMDQAARAGEPAASGL